MLHLKQPVRLGSSARCSRGYLAYKLDTVKTVLFCTDWSLREMLYFYKRASFNRKVMLKILPLPSLILLDAFSRHYKHLSYFIQRYKTLEFFGKPFILHDIWMCVFVWMDEHITVCRWRSEDNFVGVRSLLLWVLGIRLSLSCFRGVFTLWVSYLATPTLNYRWI